MKTAAIPDDEQEMCSWCELVFVSFTIPRAAADYEMLSCEMYRGR